VRIRLYLLFFPKLIRDFLVAVVVFSWATQAAADTLFDLIELEVWNLVAEVFAGNCDNNCNIVDFDARRVAGLLQQDQYLEDVYLMTSKSNFCGSRGCASAIIAIGTNQAYYLRGGYFSDPAGEHIPNPSSLNEIFLPNYVGSREEAAVGSNKLQPSSAPTTQAWVIQEFVDDLVGTIASVNLQRIYDGGALFGIERDNYLLIKRLEADRIVEETFQGPYLRQIEENDSCKNRTGFCISLRDHTMDGHVEYALSSTHAGELILLDNSHFSLSVGVYEQINIVNLERTDDPNCELKVRLRSWFESGSETNTYKSIQRYTGFDGFLSDICLYSGRNGLEIKSDSMVFSNSS